MSDGIPRTPSPFEPLPPELLDTERQLLADGAAWERNVPAADTFIRRIRSQLQEDSMRDQELPEISPIHARHPTPTDGSAHVAPRRPGRWRTLVATAAALVIVALLGAVFAALAPNHGKPGVAGTGPNRQPPLGTQTPAPAQTPIGTQVHTQLGVLKKQPSMTNQPGTPVVAPSDPRMMYEYADNQAGPVLRRSTNGGKSWSDVAFPQSTNGLGAVYLAVSPLDPQNIFLGIDVSIPSGGQCVVHAEIRGSSTASSGSSLCPLVYRSSDGGDIWYPVPLPNSGTLFPTGVVFSYDFTVLQGQGNRLYARVFYNPSFTNPSLDIHILSTTDAGATWQVADGALTKLHLHVCAFAAPPAGSTLFAISAATCNTAGSGTLWRSNDAGASWAQVGSIPNWTQPNGPSLVAANRGGDPASPLLYNEAALNATFASGDITVSGDGGKTWQPAPTAGLPKGASLLLPGTAPLPDGSLVVAFASGGSQQAAAQVATYYWSPGTATWQRLTPDVVFPAANLSNVFVSASSAGVAVTFSIGDITTSDPLYTIQPFA